MADSTSETLESTTFARLKPYCVEILDLLRTPKKSAPFLRDMAGLIRRAPPQSLQPSLDYTMFPLLLLLDAAVGCRKGDGAAAMGGGLEIGDSVAEGVLLCIEELLKKCHLGSVNQMVVVLKKLTTGALLSPTEAAEEFREGIVRCFRAMIFRIHPCSVESCLCKGTTMPALISSLETRYATSMMYFHEPDECLLAFLQSQNASAAIGHWLSLLLQIAETEVTRGHRGSSSLRMEALLTLRVLVAKIGNADALAFFLPGMVSRFSKALHLTKNMISGAAGSTGSIEHAVLGLSEFLMIVLNDEANLNGLNSIDSITWLSPNKIDSTQSVLDALRHLPSHQSKDVAEIPKNPSSHVRVEENNDRPQSRTLYVHRTKEWIDRTSENVDKLLSATFPHLAIHPTEKVRRSLVEGIRGLLTSCYRTLKRSKLMLLECLCVLICDDSVIVSAAAHESLESLFKLGTQFLKEDEVAELFTSLIERLPRVVLGSEETAAVSHARRLLALIYYAGPELVVEHLLSSPIKSSHFLEFLKLSLGHNSQFTGPVNKLISSKPLSIGYLLSVAELKAGALMGDASHSFGVVAPSIPDISVLEDKNLKHTVDSEDRDYELPHMPPWFVNIGSEKLYAALAGILRLSGLSTVAGHRSDVSLSVLVDILLDSFHKLILELRIKDYNKEGWQSWYLRSGSGLLLRQTSSAICMLNEIMYGISDKSINLYSELFGRKISDSETINGMQFACDKNQSVGVIHSGSTWKVKEGKEVRDLIVHCIGSILHEYMCPELWELPADSKSPLLEHDPDGELSLYFFRDITMLHQEIFVIIEGIGIFSLVLGKDFISSGFMHSTLYLLLQNLICSSSQIRCASDAVLRVLSAATGHSSVGHLVVANADYIVDSLCRQLRHLDLNLHVPDVFAAILSYIGVAHEILPLLDEPMRAVSLELEVLGRHQHPHLTIPFLKAVSEITKAARSESSKLSDKAESFYANVHAQFSSGPGDAIDVKFQLEHMEELLHQLNAMRRYRRIVGSLAASCLNAAIPLLSSLKEPACLLALNIVEDVTISIAKVEEAYKHEKQTKIAIEKAVQLYSSNDLDESMDVAEDEADENRLLPAMNKIWPYLILSMKNKVSVAVIRKCTSVITKAVQVSGGDFFIRRFHTDGAVIWKHLTSSPFHKKHTALRSEPQKILLPYRSSSLSSEDPIAESSSLKIQIAILHMIAELSSNKRSASAIDAVLKKVSGLVIGIACSNVTGLRDASMKALSGLSRIDPDLIWLLVADVYYSLRNEDNSLPFPPVSDLPEMHELLPPPQSPKEYLYVQYGGESSGFDIDYSSVELAFQKMQSGEFT